MKKVYLENLIRYEGGNNKGKINWQQNIGQYVKFTYDDIIWLAEIFAGIYISKTII